MINLEVRNYNGIVYIDDISRPASPPIGYGKNTIVEYLAENGYDMERDRFESLGYTKGDNFTVELCYIGRSSSEYKFKDINGQFNTVMFRKV